MQKTDQNFLECIFDEHFVAVFEYLEAKDKSNLALSMKIKYFELSYLK